uniref:Uncharacterized protein n=1 Tax=Leersia perrieri TaxID=77586 RepID=A0A0D9X2M4_9ORYZ
MQRVCGGLGEPLRRRAAGSTHWRDTSNFSIALVSTLIPIALCRRPEEDTIAGTWSRRRARAPAALAITVGPMHHR